MKTLIQSLSMAAAAALLITSGVVRAEQPEEAQEEGETVAQQHCPIMGGRINPELYADVRGQRVYVCCRPCIAQVQNDPEAALAKLGERGEYAESLQERCPVMGGRINRELYVEHKGRRIYVCCAGCLAPVRRDPERYASKVAEEHEATNP